MKIQLSKFRSFVSESAKNLKYHFKKKPCAADSDIQEIIDLRVVTDSFYLMFLVMSICVYGPVRNILGLTMIPIVSFVYVGFRVLESTLVEKFQNTRSLFFSEHFRTRCPLCIPSMLTALALLGIAATVESDVVSLLSQSMIALLAISVWKVQALLNKELKLEEKFRSGEDDPRFAIRKCINALNEYDDQEALAQLRLSTTISKAALFRIIHSNHPEILQILWHKLQDVNENTTQQLFQSLRQRKQNDAILQLKEYIPHNETQCILLEEALQDLDLPLTRLLLQETLIDISLFERYIQDVPEDFYNELRDELAIVKKCKEFGMSDEERLKYVKSPTCKHQEQCGLLTCREDFGKISRKPSARSARF